MWIKLDEEIAELFADLRAPSMRKQDGFSVVKKSLNLNNIDGRCRTAPISQQIFELYSSGQTAQQVSVKLGVSKTAVVNLLHKIGVPLRKAARNKVNRELAKELHTGGMTVSAIAKRFGVSQQAIAKVLKCSG